MAKVILLIVIALVAAAGVAPLASSDLIDAARNADTEAVRALLGQAGAADPDVDAVDPDGTTALHWASYHDDLDSADLLIRAGAPVDAANDLGVTPLWTASQNGSTAMVLRLLMAGADPNLELLVGETPVMVAARAGKADVVALLAEHGANLNQRAARDQTALMWAAAQKHARVVEVLLDHGADVHARSAVWSQVMAVPPHAFPEHNRDVPHGGNTALMFAARSGAIASARHLVAAGANVDDQDAWGVSATTLAAHSGYAELVEFLLGRDADPDAADAGFAALHVAVMRRDEQVVAALLEHGADPDIRLQTWTPKRRASADHNFAPALVGATPFWLAARFAEPRLMRVLVDHGADPTFVHDIEYQQDYRRSVAARPREVTTTIMAAAGMGGDVGRAWVSPNQVEPEDAVLEAITLATEHGVDPNAADARGDTALHQAAFQGLDQVTGYLVEHGARLDLKNDRGQTPLAVAVARGRGGFTVDLLRSLEPDTVAAEGGPITITPINHASVQLEHAGIVIHLDPWSEGDYSAASPADLILVTDIPADHFDQAAIAAVRKPGSPVVIPPAATEQIADGTPLANGETRTLAGVQVETIPMYDLIPGEPVHPKGRGNGYLLTLGGRRVYVAGVTECVPEVRALRDIEVVFVPMNLPQGRMTPAAAAECVRDIDPAVAYVYHYRDGDIFAFRDALADTDIEVRLPDWYPGDVR